jgi:hypothetical protein
LQREQSFHVYRKISLAIHFIIIHYSLLLIFIFFNIRSRVSEACEKQHDGEEATGTVSNNLHEKFDEPSSAVDGFIWVCLTVNGKVVARAHHSVVIETEEKHDNEPNK